jgi:hypothetical protein
MSRRLSCPPLGFLRLSALARATTSGRASAWLLLPSTFTPVARLRRRAWRQPRDQRRLGQDDAHAVARDALQHLGEAFPLVHVIGAGHPRSRHEHCTSQRREAESTSAFCAGHFEKRDRDQIGALGQVRHSGAPLKGRAPPMSRTMSRYGQDKCLRMSRLSHLSRLQPFRRRPKG